MNFGGGYAGSNANGLRLFIESNKIKIADSTMSLDTYLRAGADTGLDNGWHHIAIVRSGNTITAYLDGSSDGSTATASGSGNTGTSTLKIAGEGDAGFTGYMDEIRISNTARYTSNFTVATTAFTSDANTLLLVHGELQAAVAEVTGMDLISTSNTASTAPTKGDMTVLIEDNLGTATINTDIKGYVSRDGGSGWDQGTLVHEGTWGTNKKVLSFHDTTFSNSASGTDIRYKITTHNQSGSKETRIHATSLAWS